MLTDERDEEAIVLNKFKRVKVAQLCPILCDPMDYAVYGILQARILEWAAFPFSRGSSQPRDGTQVSGTAGGIFTNSAMREGLETSASLDKQNPTLARIPAHLIVCFFPHPLIVPLLVDYGVLPF